MSSYAYKTFQLKKYQNFLKQLEKSSHAIILQSDDELLLNIMSKLFVMQSECTAKNAEPCFICPNCQKIVDGNAVDVEWFGVEKSIVVEDSEKIVLDSFVLPLEFKQKYFVLNGFDNATVQAQNKLLKVIEEPRSFDKFIILANNLNAVLPTIKSRCQTFCVPRFDDAELALVFDFDGAGDKNLSICTEFAMGNLTKLEQVFKDEDFIKIYNLCLQVTTDMLKSSQVLQFSSQIVKFKGKIDVFVQILLSMYEDILAIKLQQQQLIKNKKIVGSLLSVANSMSVLAVENILKEIQSVPQKLKFNVNINGVVDNLLLRILEIKHLCR